MNEFREVVDVLTFLLPLLVVALAFFVRGLGAPRTGQDVAGDLLLAAGVAGVVEFGFPEAGTLLMCCSLAFYLWSGKRVADGGTSGPTHPKDRSYDGGQQSYPWNDE